MDIFFEEKEDLTKSDRSSELIEAREAAPFFAHFVVVFIA